MNDGTSLLIVRPFGRLEACPTNYIRDDSVRLKHLLNYGSIKTQGSKYGCPIRVQRPSACSGNPATS